MYITINKEKVEVKGRNKEIAVQSQIFKNWKDTLDVKFKVKSIQIQSVDLAGPSENPRVLFMKFKADVTDKDGNFIPGIVFMRGGSVGILVLLNYKQCYFTILTLQPRFPAGCYNFPEIPAGMLDGDGNFSGVAAKEIKEETGLVISEKNLVDLTGLVYKEKWHGIYPSAGGCDEYIRLFLYCKNVSFSEIRELVNKQTGNINEGENIKLKIVPLDNMVIKTPDAKTLSVLCLYNYLKNNSKI